MIQKSQIEDMMAAMRHIVFPQYTEMPLGGEATDVVREILTQQLSQLSAGIDITNVVEQFMASLPEITRLLHTDVKAVMHNDPAVGNMAEVILCYPAVTVMLHYRTAHCLHTLNVPILPRFITEMAHSATGVDIHPAAQIGEYFGIDHGTGIVIGATSIIGHHVMLYQGVTLGAKNFSYDDAGQPLDLPRHPIIEDNVTIYSNTSVLGRIRIGHDSTIGGNVWLTHDVAPNSMVLQGRIIEKQ